MVDSSEGHSSAPVRAYFIGSGRIGVPALRALIDSTAVRLLGIAAQPDRPAGRRRVPRPTPIADFATDRGFAVDKPASVNEAAFLESLAERGPEIVIVFSFGQILRKDLLHLPPHGCMNIHASLLPRHRGAAPISAAIKAGDSETGICFMDMDEGLDTGPVYGCERVPLDGTETAGLLETSLAERAGASVVDMLVRVCRDGLEPSPQDEGRRSYAGQIRKEHVRLDWRKPADVLEREVRAYNPWPRSWFLLPTQQGMRRIQVTAASVVPGGEQAPGAARPGSVLPRPAGTLRIACGEESLQLDEVVPEGKGRMAADAFLRGTQLNPDARLPLPED